MEWIVIFILISTLIVLSWIDFKTFLLPDYLTLPLLCFGLISTALNWINWATIYSACLGVLIGWLSIYALNFLYRKIRGLDGIGMGDAKLLGALGAFLGWESLPYILIIASISGLIGGYIWLKVHQQDQTHPFPFGPFIAFGGVSLLIYQRFVIN